MDNKAETALAKARNIELGDGWFEIIKLPNDIFALLENGYIQEVRSFLVIGSKKALLFDTGMGISDISKIVEQLTDREIVVVNSHTYFDHIGDDWRFLAVHVYADDYAVNVLSKGHSHWDVRYDSDPELFSKAYPSGFILEKYSIKPVEKENIHLLHDGDIIDLGNRQMEVLHTPGHSHDSIMLLDRENRILLTGDTYCEWLLAFFDSTLPKYGESNLEVYAHTMRKIAKLVPDLEFLYPSHGQLLADPKILIKVTKAFEKIARGGADYSCEAIYGEDRRVYEFDGFLIWTN
jgi:glyoxylase-like metal-dependent hydrolase (beta-lactamase superfamily II)